MNKSVEHDSLTPTGCQPASRPAEAGTAGTYHVPVLLGESVDGLNIRPGGVYVDATFGGGGHSREILRRMTGGHLYSFDQDADAERNAVEAAGGALFDDRFTFVRSNFRYLSNWMRYYGVEHIDGLLADLGVSSHHFDDASRGFSFRFDAPLDMRMNKRAGKTASDLVNTYAEERLADVFYLYGELRNSRRLASAVVKARQQQPLQTTGELLRAIAPVYGCKPMAAGNGETFAQFQERLLRQRGGGADVKKDVTRLFQALRIEVNHELDALRDLLQSAITLLNKGGRLSVITYHSLEDRIVKNIMKSGNATGRPEQDFFGRIESPLEPVGSKVITPGNGEMVANPRSRSAKLRIAAKR